MVEADIGAALQGGSGTIRGPPELVAATLAALRSSQSTGSRPALATPRRPRNSSAWRSCQILSTPASGDSSPASTPDSSPSESHFPMPPESLQEHLLQELGPSAIGSKPKLPGLGLDRLGPQVAATPRSYVPAVESTPRCFSIRTPPGSTPRVLSLVTPRSRQQCLGTRSPSAAVAATPRSLSRICSIVTPRSGFGIPCAASTGQRPMAPMQQLAEDRMPSDRGHEDGGNRDSASPASNKLVEPLVAVSFDETPAEDSDSSDASEVSEASEPEQLVAMSFDEMPTEDGDCSNASEADPEWMSFATPVAGDLYADFDELWSQDEVVDNDAANASRSEEPAAVTTELTSEAIWQLVAGRAQQEIARALEEAERSRQLQRTLPRRPKTGERGEHVAELSRQAQNSEVLRPLSERLGSAMQDAGRLAREARAVVASRAPGRSPSGSADTFTPSPALVEAEARRPEGPCTPRETRDSTNAKTKVAHAANAMKTKMLERIPKGFQRPSLRNMSNSAARRKKELDLLTIRSE